MKKFLAMMICALMVVSALAGCAPQAAKTEAPKTEAAAAPATDAAAPAADAAAAPEAAGRTSSEDRMVMAITTEPGRLRSDTISTLAAAPYNSIIYDYLFNRDAAGEYEYSICESYELDADNMGVTMHLRPGVKFHNGNPMDAEDVLYSLIYGGQDTTYGSQMEYLDYDNSKIIDDNTLYLKFAQINSFWQNPLVNIGIIEKEAYEASTPDAFYLDPMTTACYVLENWVSGDSLTFKAFDQYWKGKPAIETVVLRVIPESSVGLMELQTGGIDVLFNMSTENYNSACTFEGVRGYDGQPSPVSVALGFNLKNEALNKLEVRQALACAIDLQAICDGAFDGAADPCYSPLGQNAFGYDARWETEYPYTYNPEKAKEMLAAAGYKPGDLTFRVICDETPARNLMAEQLYNMFGDVGVNLVIEKYDYATATDIVSNQEDAYDMYIRGFANNNGELYFMCANSVGTNSTNRKYEPINGPRYDEIWKQAELEMDPKGRAELYKTFQQEFIENMMYWIPGVQTKLYTAFDSRLTGIDTNRYFWIVDGAYFE